MARYTEAVCRLCRREGVKLFLKGDRCFSAKCGVERRGYPPGQHGQGRSRFSDYGVQLREKQKVKRMYGLLEKQFARVMERATRMKGRSGENLLQPSSAASTTSCSGSASRPRAPRRASSCGTGTSR
jgi:small subunit ribosomal protein S4